MIAAAWISGFLISSPAAAQPFDIDAGADHACTLTAQGGVVCWGYNAFGQLGDGTETNSGVPTPVSGLASGVAAVATGSSHSCALTTGGGVLCWGNHAQGQLGAGAVGHRSSVPVAVSGLASGVVAIAAGATHSCAVDAAGGALCWGSNLHGALGNSGGHTNVPVAVSGLSTGVAAIAAGGDLTLGGHTCALTTGGAMLCWGRNSKGQLGNGNTLDSSTPTPVSGLSSGVAAMTTGGTHTCALTASGNALCWGDNGSGQVGDGTTAPRSTPVAVASLSSGNLSIEAGQGHTCAIDATGGALCWGKNLSGQLGDGTDSGRTLPTPVSGLPSGAARIAPGERFSCARTLDGGALCWGYNVYGQLGDAPLWRAQPAMVRGLASGVAQTAAGDRHTCARTTAGGALCWGTNFFGELGDGTGMDRGEPTPVSGLSSGVAEIAAGLSTCARTTAGGALCWGDNSGGQLGDGTYESRLAPVSVTGIASQASSIATMYHSCAVVGGAARCWGINDQGQLGNGSQAWSATPVTVSGLGSGIAAVAVAYWHSCALAVDGVVRCWGNNWYGQLGDGTTTNRSTPVVVPGIPEGAISIAAAGSHSCALTAGGAVLCWGSNGTGELGDGTTIASSVPVAVSGLSSGVLAITAGAYHGCAVLGPPHEDNLRCWGGGIGLVPVAVSGLPVPVASVSGSASHICATGMDGSAWCWGSDLYGQLGQGRRLRAPTPVRVMPEPAAPLGIAAAVAALVGLSRRRRAPGALHTPTQSLRHRSART